MKKYDIDHDINNCRCSIEECDDGEYNKVEDVQKLQEERDLLLEIARHSVAMDISIKGLGVALGYNAAEEVDKIATKQCEGT